ncbi:ASCH domain-containing protein [Vibrio alginolyticus]|uniref:ASCH domain-containing protein n=1 Tax=Vibrio alginolyticus TaxID=663 RepID=UPI00354E79B5|nr:ASCH domain-containing protein [Vibrio alginolyticus]
MTDIILSIKPDFTNQILLGNKTIELRKKIGKNFSNGSVIYIYSSSPQQAIVGKVILTKVELHDVETIALNYSREACVNESYIRDYYNQHDKGYLLLISSVTPFSKPLPLSKLKKYGFNPPQSFCYAKGDVLELLRSVQ